MVADLREICARYSTDSLQVTVFQPFFIYIDQYLVILPQTLQTIFVTAAVMVLISMLLIPNPACVLLVSFSIVSIELGVVGYMAWWGVRLDGVALINLIMCMGFSVDFSSHISYHYITASSHDVVDSTHSLSGRPEDRIKASLYALGIPIIQGASSTILGVLGLAFASSYLFVTFFKMIFLVILLGASHGLILLPVLLSLMGPGSCKSKSDTSSATNSSSKKTRSSGLSTPTLNAITCHRVDNHKSIESQDSCYTINMGYVSHEEPSQFVPYHYHQYLQQTRAMQPSSIILQDPALVESTEQSSPTTSCSSSSSHNKHQHRHHQNKNHQATHHHRHRRHQHQPRKTQRQQAMLHHPVQMLEALNASYNTELVLKPGESEQNKQLDLHLAAISRIQQRYLTSLSKSASKSRIFPTL